MKNIPVLFALVLLIAACNPTRNELRVSRRTEKRSMEMQADNIGKSELYASTKKIISSDNNFYDSLQRKGDRAQIEILQKIEKDKAVSFQNLKKSMTAKVYITTLAIDVNTSTMAVQEDTVYSVKDSGWYVVE